VQPFDIPIAFCIFNRPQPTRQVFEAIRAVHPKELYLIGDGPRSDVASDQTNVELARNVVANVDWVCDVKVNFSDTNLGCKQRMASGIDWAFESAEQLIILEDDCLPDVSFFEFCRVLLDRYREDERVMMISGDNFQPQPTTEYSYYFSRWAHIWGWATWKRAWQNFDVEVSSWPKVRAERSLFGLMSGDDEYLHWVNTLDQQHAGQIDTWDFPWMYAMWINSGLCILPERNLVTNLGFGDDATHTTDASSKLANLASESIQFISSDRELSDEEHSCFGLKHPPRVMANYLADQYSWENIFRPAPVQDSEKKRWLDRILNCKVSPRERKPLEAA
jgi:hypothetical protein